MIKHSVTLIAALLGGTYMFMTVATHVVGAATGS